MTVKKKSVEHQEKSAVHHDKSAAYRNKNRSLISASAEKAVQSFHLDGNGEGLGAGKGRAVTP